jgi:hypothetical protein
MQLDVGFVEDAPWPSVRPEFDAVLLEAVVVRHAAVKEETKGGQVGQRLSFEPEVLREMRFVA